MKFAKFFAIATIATASFVTHANDNLGQNLAACSGVFATVSKLHIDNGGNKAEIRANTQLSSAFAKAAAVHIGEKRTAEGASNLYGGLLLAFRENDPKVAADLRGFVNKCTDMGVANNVSRFLK